MNTLFIYFLLALNLVNSTPPQLTINIENIESVKGEIVIGIYNSEIGFLGEETVLKEYKITVDNTTERFIITDLPIGNYAVSLFHDENSDGICNLNFIGIPKEPYGFSNNFKPKFSAPKFKDCKFSLNKDLVLNIKLIN
ncbi:DUF2141 domain-containing protein [Xanthomarina sp. F1114]|uniref:DUF2141 domain-containing protein n=1 Tax=Xanthomarina sp. F1114 TaxID=2996019 RepID=UPI00225E4632|nr:DUF2141 domain-containing protein [Xanthomarina sp. F1114]MCX7548265.1 DUF2141 domain-containing protein [Xanthomarina sp. F1114]